MQNVSRDRQASRVNLRDRVNESRSSLDTSISASRDLPHNRVEVTWMRFFQQVKGIPKKDRGREQ